MVLHTVNKSPYQHYALRDCLQLVGDNDSLVLIEDGVYGLLAAAPSTEQLLLKASQGLKLYAIEDDLASRGLMARLPAEVTPISYAQFVELTIEHLQIQSWY